MERNEIKERGREIADGVPAIEGVLIDSNGDGVFDKVLMDSNGDGVLDTTANYIFYIDSATTTVDPIDGV